MMQREGGRRNERVEDNIFRLCFMLCLDVVGGADGADGGDGGGSGSHFCSASDNKTDGIRATTGCRLIF